VAIAMIRAVVGRRLPVRIAGHVDRVLLVVRAVAPVRVVNAPVVVPVLVLARTRAVPAAALAGSARVADSAVVRVRTLAVQAPAVALADSGPAEALVVVLLVQTRVVLVVPVGSVPAAVLQVAVVLRLVLVAVLDRVPDPLKARRRALPSAMKKAGRSVRRRAGKTRSQKIGMAPKGHSDFCFLEELASLDARRFRLQEFAEVRGGFGGADVEATSSGDFEAGATGVVLPLARRCFGA